MKIRKRTSSNAIKPVLRSRIWLFVLLFAAIIASAVYLVFAWNRYHKNARTEAINLAQSVVALLHYEHIQHLSGTPEDIELLDYILTKQSLKQLSEATNPIHFAYILAYRDQQVIFLVDAEDEKSPDYSPPGQVYYEASAEDLIPFLTGDSVVSGPATDRWGTWYSALTPISNPEGTHVVAVLGIDYSVTEWNSKIYAQMIPDGIVIMSLFVAVLALLFTKRKHDELKIRSAVVEKEEKLFHGVFDQAPIGIAIVNDKSFVYRPEQDGLTMNAMFAKILGRTELELMKIPWPQITHPDDLEIDMREFDRLIKGEIEGYTIEKRFIKPDGSIVWTSMKVASLLGTEKDYAGHLCLIEDITMRKMMEQELTESERSKSVLLAHLPGMAYRCAYDKSWTMKYVSSGCEELTGYLPSDLIENRELSYSDLIVEEYRDLLWREWIDVLREKKYFRYEYEITTKNHDRKWVLELGQGIFDTNGRVEALEGVIVDVSELKKREVQIQYLSQHDFLTGLYNRKYFEELIQRLEDEGAVPVSVIICDINGLKVINNIFGHAEGDRVLIDVAHLIQSCCGDQEILSRTGGDEFTIVMPNTSFERTQEMYQQIQHMMESFYKTGDRVNYEVSISIGYGIKNKDSQTIKDTITTAEEYLLRRKLLNQSSYHNSVLSSIMATLYARSNETEEHGRRLTQLTKMLGESIGLEQAALDDLELLSMLHDVGKIGIDDRILKKPGRLTNEEWVQMRKHSEIGYRIAMATPELQHIAGLILRHHERWDGTGYPGGLKGFDIPLASRILAVADAYDAMTENRVYRDAMNPTEALVEIEAHAGTQFDPELCSLFVNLIRQQNGNQGSPSRS